MKRRDLLKAGLLSIAGAGLALARIGNAAA